MEKYRSKTQLAEISDHFLRFLATCLPGIGWFVFLWGVTLPALLSGLALGAMLWLCLRQYVKSSTHKKEQLMRQLIGGELALERLLLEAPRKAAFHCALWLESAYPLQMNQTVEWGIIGQMNEKKTFFRLIAQHPSQPVSTQQMVECAREAHLRNAEILLLCMTAPVSKEAAAYAANLSPPTTLISRETLIRYAGAATPATDEDLRNLIKRKQKRLSRKEWLAVMLDNTKARKYLWYGIGMSLYALLMGNTLYFFPGITCVGLYLLCRLRPLFLTRRMH